MQSQKNDIVTCKTVILASPFDVFSRLMNEKNGTTVDHEKKYRFINKTRLHVITRQRSQNSHGDGAEFFDTPTSLSNSVISLL